MAFSFAIAALLTGRLDTVWCPVDETLDERRMVLPYGGDSARQLVGLLRAWLGRLVVLGPGRERLVHALAGRHRARALAGRDGERGAFKSWTVFLAVAAFSLSLLGAFIVRSGVLTSVHAFAVDPERGLFLLVLLC